MTSNAPTTTIPAIAPVPTLEGFVTAVLEADDCDPKVPVARFVVVKLLCPEVVVIVASMLVV
jgi:hypothetical protein